jgi:hypothetical protein
MVEKIKIYEMFYDNPLNDDGTEKPNKLLGEFEIIDGDMDMRGYDYVVYGKDSSGELWKIEGIEVLGLYSPGLGGTEHKITKLSECEEVRIYLKHKQ